MELSPVTCCGLVLQRVPCEFANERVLEAETPRRHLRLIVHGYELNEHPRWKGRAWSAQGAADKLSRALTTEERTASEIVR